MKLRKLTSKDKKIFDSYLRLKEHELSVYAFANTYIWKALFEISWALIEGSLCIFFQDRIGMFLYLAPLGKSNNLGAAIEAFRIMDSVNRNKEVSRIENIAEQEIDFYRQAGYVCRQKSCDYLCSRKKLAFLSGDKFKPKRSSRNYFIKNYEFEYRKFALRDINACLRLYDEWMDTRCQENADSIYRAMMRDSRNSLKVAFNNYAAFDYTGRVIEINGRIKAFTIGFQLNKQTFCILYEITDLSVKGLAQFIFARFCDELKEHEFINIMDDSGLDNLKKVKLSYQPVRLVPNYIATRTSAIPAPCIDSHFRGNDTGRE